MSDITRKDFLRLTSWGIVATLLPVNTIVGLTSIRKNNSNSLSDDFALALELAQQAKQKFYLKNFALAESLYMQAINLAPNYIQIYDGLDNVFGAQNKNLQSVLLYRNALLINTTKIAFYDRAARSLLRLQTGNKKLNEQYKISIDTLSLLNDAKTLYQEAILIDNTKEYLTIGLAKVNKKIEIADFEADFRVNKVYRILKTQHKNSYNTGLNNKSNEEIKELINKVDRKVRRPLIDLKEIEHRRVNIIIQKKRFYNILNKRNNITNPEKIENAEKLFQVDYKDPFSLKRVKIAYYTNNLYFDFIEIRRNFAIARNSVFGYLGIMDAMETAFKKGQASNDTLDDAIAIGYNLKDNWPLNFEQEIEVVIKTAKILSLRQMFTEAKALLEEEMVRVKSVSSGMNNKLIHLYAKIHFDEGSFVTAEYILHIGVKELTKDIDNLILNNPKFAIVKQLADNKTTNVFKDNLSLYYLLHSSYKMQQKDLAASVLLSRLYANNHQDNFVLTRNQ